MVEIRSHTEIRRPPEAVFDLLADFRGQARWLDESSVYRGTDVLTDGPVAVGTAYRESAPTGIRNGVVTELERPTRFVCRQPLTLRPRIGTVDVTLVYSVTGTGADSTHVERMVTLGVPWWLKPMQPVLVRIFRTEGERTLGALKAHAES